MTPFQQHKNEKGAVLVLFAVLLSVFIVFMAFAIDFGQATVVFNELQNSADSGALAGSHELFLFDPTTLKLDKDKARDAATVAAEKNLEGMAGAKIETIRFGHWTFPNGPFLPNDSDYQVETPYPDMNSDPDYINAIEVTVTRSDAFSGFARWFHPENYQRTRKAVAAVGAYPLDTFQAPLMMCLVKVIDPATGSENCSSIRESNSQVDTGGWTNFAACDAEGPHPKDYVCRGNPPLRPGAVHLPPGQANSAYKELRDCWLKNKSLDRVDADGIPIPLKADGTPDRNGDGEPDQPWKLKLPVIECAGDKVSSCEEIIGVVEVEILWITTHQGNQQAEVPPFMLKHGKDPMDPTSYWKKSDFPDDATAWANFVNEFNLVGNPDLNSKEIYIKPSCKHDALDPGDYGGTTQISVLVQ